MEPEKTLNEKAAIQRAAIAHRARWMALLFEELERDGMPADRIEQIMRRAVRRCGKMDGQAYRDAASDPASVKEIIQTRFANEMGQASFAKKTSQPQRKQAWCIAASARWWMPGRKWRCPRIVLSCCAILRWMETGQSWICWDFPWSCPVRLHMGTPPAPCIIAGIPNNTNFLRRTYQ